MSKQLNDDEITKLYQQSSDELPPKQLDDAILSHAFDALKSEKQPVLINSNRKWHYSGIAAALIAVVVFAPWQYFISAERVPVESPDTAAMQYSKPVEKSTSPIERTELLADELQLERIELTGSRIERAVPEQRARKVQSAPAKMLKAKESNLVLDFNPVITKLEEQDKIGAEKALIELLQAKPNLHNEIPQPLQDLYQELLESGKITKPEHK